MQNRQRKEGDTPADWSTERGGKAEGSRKEIEGKLHGMKEQKEGTEGETPGEKREPRGNAQTLEDGRREPKRKCLGTG